MSDAISWRSGSSNVSTRFFTTNFFGAGRPFVKVGAAGVSLGAGAGTGAGAALGAGAGAGVSLGTAGAGTALGTALGFATGAARAKRPLTATGTGFISVSSCLILYSGGAVSTFFFNPLNLKPPSDI